mmetsp:Transcript_40327/g.127697  ORF Transcript_40327/g.127697 Transcript_40327/m.127697 type:complete len:138 (-) Transcript_40327:469-882(-)
MIPLSALGGGGGGIRPPGGFNSNGSPIGGGGGMIPLGALGGGMGKPMMPGSGAGPAPFMAPPSGAPPSMAPPAGGMAPQQSTFLQTASMPNSAQTQRSAGSGDTLAEVGKEAKDYLDVLMQIAIPKNDEDDRCGRRA